MTERVTDQIVAGVERLRGGQAARLLRSRGLEHLHEVIEWRDVGALRDQVLDALRPSLLAMAVAAGRRFLRWHGDFYLDDYLVLRVNFPYEAARRADGSENPGVGRLSEKVRTAYASRKVIDPVFQPATYHRGLPPAAWAHGPHVDTWAGHSREGRNIWWAIGNVPAAAGLVLYPELADKNLPCDPRSLYLAAGYPVPRPTPVPVAAGEMLIYDPQIPHGTHLNTTTTTRVVVSMRLNAAEPTFDPVCFYAREFWRRAADIECGRDEVLHLRREDHLATTVAAPADPPEGLPVVAGVADPASGVLRAALDERLAKARRAVLEAPGRRVILARVGDGWRAYDAACPYNGIDLADGACDDDRMYCPGCAVDFDLRTGRSDCPTLALRAFEVWEADGAVNVRVGP